MTKHQAKRIEALEQQMQEPAGEQLVIFRAIFGTVPQGWVFNDSEGKQVCIARLRDETEEELMLRTAAAARLARPGRPIRCMQATDEEFNRLATPTI